MIDAADRQALREWAPGATWLENEPLASYTMIRIGGPAALMAIVRHVDQLSALVAYAGRRSMPLTFLGGGSNVLVGDAGIPGLVVVNRCRKVVFRSDGLVWAESGAPLAGLARQAINQGLTGLTWAVSIPGSVGGAVIGNAGAYGSDVAASLRRVMLLQQDGTLVTWPARRLQLSYRDSALKQRLRKSAWVPLLIAAQFQLQPGDTATMRSQAEDYLARRRLTQPKAPSMGSVFKNPPGDYAGRLIEAVGLKGYRVGGAAISSLHANFIVNLGDASAANVLALMEMARRQVKRHFRVALEPEVMLVGSQFEAE